jgi:hypothetical protein
MLLHNAAQACILCGGPLDREGPEAVKLSSRPLEIAPPENVGEDDTRVYADSLNFIPAIGDHEDESFPLDPRSCKYRCNRAVEGFSLSHRLLLWTIQPRNEK